MVLHQTFKWGKTNPPVPKQQLVWNSKVRNINKTKTAWPLFSEKERKKESFLTSFLSSLPLCFCLLVFVTCRN